MKKKNNLLKKLSFCILLIIMSSDIFAQKNISPIELEQLRINKFFDEYTPWETVVDTCKIYAFAFKVAVEKNTKEEVKIISLSANDSMAYRLFPKYKFFESVDFGLFMKGRTEAKFIFPVILEVWNQNWPEVMPKQDQLELAKLAFDCCDDTDIQNKIYFKPVLLRMDLSIKF